MFACMIEAVLFALSDLWFELYYQKTGALCETVRINLLIKNLLGYPFPQGSIFLVVLFEFMRD